MGGVRTRVKIRVWVRVSVRVETTVTGDLSITKLKLVLGLSKAGVSVQAHERMQ